jgi:hypothetical protein
MSGRPTGLPLVHLARVEPGREESADWYLNLAAVAQATARSVDGARQVELTLTTLVPSEVGLVSERVVATGTEAERLEYALKWHATPAGE